MATRDQDVTHSGDAGPGVLVREGSYGTQVFEVEPGGAEFIPLNERHGRPLQLFWTWTSPNMEFATIFVGALALNVLTHLPQVLCLLIIVAVQVTVAFFGYNLVHLFERYAFPILTIIFVIASIVILTKAHPG